MKKYFSALIRAVLTTFLLSLSCYAFSQKWYTPEVVRQVDSIIRHLTDAEKFSYISGVDWMYTKPFKRLNVPQIKMSDGPQGLGSWGNSTAYPCTIMLTATWNEDLAYNYGKSLGQDCRARGVSMLLGPAVNIYRAPMCGRNFEYMGEDPYLASRMAVAYIKGVQGQGVMATIKHFMGNNSDYDRNHISSDIDERTMQEIYLPVFKAAVQEAGVGAIMSSYNLLNGTYTSENHWLMKSLLRDRWGYKGLVVSDWGACHHSLPCLKDGVDLEMPEWGIMSADSIRYYMNAGLVTKDMIDVKVRHILTSLVGFGLMDRPQLDKSIPLDNPKADSVALKVAREGIVLLKNEKKTLPFNTGKIRCISVVGKNALSYVRGDGSGIVHPFHYVSTLEGIKTIAEKKHIKVNYVDMTDFDSCIIFTGSDRLTKGFHAQYFDNTELKGEPVTERTDTVIHFSSVNEGDFVIKKKEQYSIRWAGVMCPEITSVYKFEIGGDDGYRLFINDKLVIDDWKCGGYRSNTYEQTLEAGKQYHLKLEYFQATGSADVNFTYDQENATHQQYIDKLNGSDVIIACFGFDANSEGEGRDRTFELPESERNMLQVTLKSTKPVIGIVNAGGNVEMQKWEPSLKGLLWAWYGGQESGTALAQTLFGEINPSGKLPVTFEKKWSDNPTYTSYLDPDGDKHVSYSEGLFVGYRGYDKLKRDVQYPFGYGMSYTTFKLSSMKVTKAVDGNGELEISCKLANTGKRDGAQVVQLYVNKGDTYVDNPQKELKAFRKVFLKAGESADVTMRLPKNAFSYYDVDKKDFVTKNGTYRVMLGFSSRTIVSEKEISLE
ncbi:MAG: glycoside hydrolase family 3 C-terminal domain-containing protein [Bacteroidota bacterium]|nr:glycoside hydrolase family 3 C-terminal domain-containing protein [Bacteroidota bacterium]